MLNFLINRSILTQVGFLFVMLFVLWFYGISSLLNKLTEQQLEIQARTVVDNVNTLGELISGHGGMWVKAGPNFNERYLDKIDAGNGVFFYSKNPARVQKEFSDKGLSNEFPASFRMVSLNPMNTDNVAMDFEAKALREMTRSQLEGKSIHSVSRHNDSQYEFIEPVIHTENCIACHGDPAKAPESVRNAYGTINGYNYKAGDLAGAIAVTIDFNKWEMLSTVISAPLLLLLLLPIVVILLFVYHQSKSISNIAKRIGSYRRGTPIGVDATTIPDNTRNEVFVLIRAAAKMTGIVEGTYAQLNAHLKAAKLSKTQSKNNALRD
jgi:hypothetical protein